MNDNNKIKTIYQSLNQFFNLSNGTFSDINTELKSSQSNEKVKIILKGNSPEEIYKKGLELQQKKELQNKFYRTTDRGYQKALQYEAARLPAYIDYEGMEYYPIISSALDLYMEEATTIGENGKMLNIYSNKERIKSLLEDFFYNIININTNLPFWTRNTVKYGDNFVLLYGEKKKGITHVKQMVNYEIERFERIVDGKPIVKFKERMTGDEFNIFEIAHFRLLGDDKYLPYGSSILNKVRRVFRQLVMSEDAMLTYRIIRAGEKKVFKIDVGNIDEDDIDDYIYKVATKFKRVSQVRPNDGQIDYRFNILENDEDYFIPVRNANTQTGIETLPGAQNLDAIHDIEYLRDNLFTGLGIPKPFLSFQDASGAGKNMAQYDIRFAKKINRVQQTMIQELNKMAITHLFLLGYTGEDLYNFNLTLTNPSTQLESLKIELYEAKTRVYRELTAKDNGIAAMSHTSAKRLLFNMSDKEIVDDLKQQKMEIVVMQELQDAPAVIKKSGLFNDIDNKYGEPFEGYPITYPQSTNIPQAQQTNNNNNQNTALGNNNIESGENETKPQANQNINTTLSEQNNDLSLNNYVNYVEKMILNTNTNKTKKDKNIINENNKKNNILNQNVNEMVNEIDELLKKNESINTNNNETNNNIDDFDINLIENIDID